MALNGARGRRTPHKPDQPERDTAQRGGPADGTGASEALDEFAAVLAKMAEAEGHPGAWQDPEDPPCGAESPPAEPSAEPIALAPCGAEAAGPIRTYRYGIADLNGGTLTYSIVVPPEAGRVLDNGDGTFDFDPGEDFQVLRDGEVRDVDFTYQAMDCQGFAATAAVTVTLTGTGCGGVALGDSVLETSALPDSANRIETVFIDGVTGAPGVGGWSIALSKGEIIETNEDNLQLSDNAAGLIIMGGDSGEIYFEGINRIEW